MDASALASLTPEQKQAVMMQAQEQANQQVMTAMVESMTEKCFEKCAGVQGDRLDSKEQACLASCQDRFLDVRKAVQDSLEKRQGGITVSASNEIREATNQSTNPINHHASHIIIPMRTISVGRSDLTHVDSTFTCTI
eukprot:scaffold894_cov260-Alexandrium_tamarense.AAC.3